MVTRIFSSPTIEYIGGRYEGNTLVDMRATMDTLYRYNQTIEDNVDNIQQH